MFYTGWTEWGTKVCFTKCLSTSLNESSLTVGSKCFFQNEDTESEVNTSVVVESGTVERGTI